MMLRYFFTSVLFGCFVASLSVAAPAASVSVTLADNAALRYWPAIYFLPKGADVDKILSECLDVPLDAKVRELVKGSKSLDYLSAGAKVRDCDWGLEYRNGPALLLPQLGSARTVARLAIVRARVEFADHKNIAAIDDIANTWALARQVGMDKTFIGLLVRYAIEKTSFAAMQSHLHDLSLAELDHLTDRLDTLPPGSSLIDTIPYERYFGVGWLLDKAKQAAAIGEPMDWNAATAGFDWGDSNTEKELSQLSPEELIAKVSSWQTFFVSAESLLRQGGNATETQKALADLRHKYARDLAANMLLPDYARAFRNQENARVAMDQFRAAVMAARGK